MAKQDPPQRTGAAAFRVTPEHRWPAAAAIIAALLFYALLPSEFNDALRFTVVGLAGIMLVPLIVLNPRRFDRESRWSRWLSIGIAVVLLIANQIALLQLVVALIRGSSDDGPLLLLAALQVWVTNVIAYSLVYWEIDRGGPIARRREQRSALPPADFRFPQDENDDNVVEVAAASSKQADWMPSYFDYLYFSASDAMAFSATDVMPLTHRAKAFMLLEAFAGFVILALVIARSVNLIG